MILSIIIPVYNCQHLITRCVESIISQGVFNFEIILIIDGSPDNSLQVCKNLANKYQNIIVIEQTNKGTSTARNNGLNKAKGDYVWFVDADDYLPQGFFTKLFPVLENENDNVIAFNYQHITHQANTIERRYEKDQIITTKQFLSNRPVMFAATKIYNKKALGNHHFCDGLKNLEDLLFNVQFLCHQKYIHLLPHIGYVYDQTNEKSTSQNRSKRNLIKAATDSEIVHIFIRKEIENIDDNDMKSLLTKDLNFSIAGYLYSLMKFYNVKRLKKAINKYSKLGLYPIGNVSRLRPKLFVAVANCKHLFILYAYYYRCRHRLKFFFSKIHNRATYSC